MSTASDVALVAAAPLARLVANVIEGHVRDPGDIARSLVGIALDAVPVDELRVYLEEEARKRQDLAFAIAETAKFGPGP